MSALSKVPGLAGFLESREANERRSLADLQQQGGLMALAEKARAMQQEQQLRETLAATGGDPAKAIPALIQSGNIAGAEKLSDLLKNQRQANAPRVVAPGSQVLGPNNEVLHTAPFAPQRPQAQPEFVNLLAIRDSLPEGHPMRQDLDRRIGHLQGEVQPRQQADPEFVRLLSLRENLRSQLPAGHPMLTDLNARIQNLRGEGAAPSDRVIQDSNSPTGWSYQDRRDPAKLQVGAPPPPGARGGASGRLPTPALRLQQEELDAINTAAAINADLGGFESQLKTGKLKLSPASNIESTVRNYTGLSSTNSRNYSSFRATLERLRNDSLRLNKGVQTEGDAVRAWNELISNINDEGVVKQRLGEIRRINERAVNFRKMNIDAIRMNYGLDPMDTSGHESAAPAVGAPAGPPAGVRVVDW